MKTKWIALAVVLTVSAAVPALKAEWDYYDSDTVETAQSAAEAQKAQDSNPASTAPVSAPGVPQAGLPALPAQTTVTDVNNLPGTAPVPSRGALRPDVGRHSCESAGYGPDEKDARGNTVPPELQCAGSVGEWHQTCGPTSDGGDRRCVPDYVLLGIEPQISGDCVCSPAAE
ncbi:MAG: hypothetical protein HY714_00200 [Candidatus Omnitrophica bacterium]|nr:hypothetical protein [Candidatus Omnitrophota bacterium]